MGNTHSQDTQIHQYWSQPIYDPLLHSLPGQPKLIHALYSGQGHGHGGQGGQGGQGQRYNEAEHYVLEIVNLNQEEEIAVYKERKIGHQNIVNVYDFYVNKDLLGCARSALSYTIITQRIPHRLQDLSPLTPTELLYIFHESCCGYEGLSKYGRLCYPNAQKIGIKQNGEVKVWVSENWASNVYVRGRGERGCVEVLWNCVKLCGTGKGSGSGSGSGVVERCNREIYVLGEGRDREGRGEPGGFEDVIEMLRAVFGKEIVEGKFTLQKRLKQLKFTRALNGIQQPQPPKLPTDPSIRPRAYSEQLRKPPEHSQHSLQQSGNPYTAANLSMSISNAQGYNKPRSTYSFREVGQTGPVTYVNGNTNFNGGVKYQGTPSTAGQIIHHTVHSSPVNIRSQPTNLTTSQARITKTTSLPTPTSTSISMPITMPITLTHSQHIQQQPQPQLIIQQQQQHSLNSTPTKTPKTNPYHLQHSPQAVTKSVQPNYYNILIQNRLNNSNVNAGGENRKIEPVVQQSTVHSHQLSINAADTRDKNRINFSYKNSQIIPDNLQLHKLLDRKYQPKHIHTHQPIQTPIQTHKQPQTQPQAQTHIQQAQIQAHKQQELYKYTNPTVVIQPAESQIKMYQEEVLLDLGGDRGSKGRYWAEGEPEGRDQTPSPIPIPYIQDNHNNTYLPQPYYPQQQPQPTSISPQPLDLHLNLNLNLNLQQITYRQQQTSKTERTTINSPYIFSTSRQKHPQRESYPNPNPGDQRSSIEYPGSYRSNQSQSHSNEIRQTPVLEIGQMSYYSPEKTRKQGEGQGEESDSRKVAEEFKYYLRSIQRSPDHQGEKNREDQYGASQGEGVAMGNNQRKVKHVYESDAPAIPERWEEEESLSLNM